MKILLGPAGVPVSSKGKSTIDGIRRVAELGLNAMEIEFVRGVHMGIPLAKEAGKAAKDEGVTLSIHAPYYVNLCNPEKLDASVKRILDSCERAHHLGAWIVVFHPGFYGGLSKGESLKRVVEACHGMSEKIESEGWDVLLGLETTGKVSQFGTLDEIAEIHGEVGRCIPAVDFSHMFARNVGRIDFPEVLEKLGSMNLERYHSHFSGIEYTVKGERKHVPIERKKPDFSLLAKSLMESNLRGISIISESPLLEQDSLKMRDALEKEGYAWKR
jgi:deoxyribonuclease-4